MRIEIPTDLAHLETVSGAQEPGDVALLGDVDDPRFWRTVSRVRTLADDHHVLILGRDWEGCVFGLVEADHRENYNAPFDVLAFTHDGHVGHGGVNMPNYMDVDDFARILKGDR